MQNNRTDSAVGNSTVQGGGQEPAKAADDDVLSEMDTTGPEAEAEAANIASATTKGLKEKVKRSEKAAKLAEKKK